MKYCKVPSAMPVGFFRLALMKNGSKVYEKCTNGNFGDKNRKKNAENFRKTK